MMSNVFIESIGDNHRMSIMSVTSDMWHLRKTFTYKAVTRIYFWGCWGTVLVGGVSP